MNTTGVHLFVNGAEASHDASCEQDGGGGRSDDTARPLMVGVNNNGNEVFDGLIDDVRIYNRALSADEVKRLYLMGR